MRIVLLAHALRGQGGWISGRNFIKALKNAAPEHQFLITAPAGLNYEDIVLPAGSAFYYCPPAPSFLKRFRFEKYRLPQIINNFKPDIVLGLGNHGARNIMCPQAIWIRNGYLVYPSKHFPNASLKTRLYIYFQKAHLAKTLKNTDIIFCQTPVMRKRISEHYNFSDTKIKTLSNALSSFLERDNSDKTVPPEIDKNKFNCLILTKYYIHKNPDVLIDECMKSPESFKDIRFITTISENDDKRAKIFLKKIKENPVLKDLIYNAGPVTHEKLGLYYRNCQLLIMPTLMESFSVTYIEAMSFDVPILATDLDFAHYLAGRAAMYYNPWVEGDFTKKLLELKNNKKLLDNLVAEGREHLKQFSHTWEEMVRETMDSLKSVVMANKRNIK